MTDPTHDCSGCTLHDRRDFLRDAFRMGVAALAAVGIAPSVASAMPLRFVDALSARGQQRTYPVPGSDGVQIDKDAEVILARSGKAVYAFALSCPHQNTALRWEGSENRFQCPKHHSKYRPDGTFIEGRATRSMDRFAVKLVNDAVVVDLDTLIQEDMDKAAWLKAFVTLA